MQRTIPNEWSSSSWLAWAAVAALSLVASSRAGAVGEPPPDLDRPPADAAPVEPPEVDDSPTPVQPLEPLEPEHKDDDGVGPHKRKGQDKGKGKAIIGEKKGGLFGAPCWGGGSGCVACGALPAFGTSVGTVAVLSGLGASEGAAACVGVASVIGGAVVGGPSLLLLGPCSSLGATTLAGAGALIDDRSIFPVLLGGLPGIVVGAAGAGLAVASFIVFQALPDDNTLPLILAGTSVGLSLLAGPISVAGSTIADATAGAADDEDDDDDEAGVEAAVALRPHARWAMAY